MKIVYIILFAALCSFSVQAQEFEVGLELRPRFEYRDGFKTPLTADQNPASFISQRSRMYGLWRDDKIQAKVSFQNIRTWGDVPTTSTIDKNAIMLHEAWASYQVSSHLAVKAGRQVISYDNQRIFGGLDWAQQGQSHDALLFAITANHQQLDIGIAVNAAEEVLFNSPYAVANYKNMQYAWYHNDLNKLKFSLLAINNGYNNEDNKTQYLQTYGTDINYSVGRKTNLHIAAYGQSGERNDKNVAAYNANIDLSQQLHSNWKIGLGYELLSGTDQNSSSNTNKSFTPLFGTNHLFNGFMDYFYAGNHQNSVGLKDSYLKVEYIKEKLNILLSPHLFYASGNILDKEGNLKGNNLGHEWDLQASYQVHPSVKVTGGYSHLFGTSSMEALKGSNADHNNWAWLMFSFQPKKIFTK